MNNVTCQNCNKKINIITPVTFCNCSYLCCYSYKVINYTIDSFLFQWDIKKNMIYLYDTVSYYKLIISLKTNKDFSKIKKELESYLI